MRFLMTYFASDSGNLPRKRMARKGQLSVTMSMEKHRHLNGILCSNVGKTVNILAFGSPPPLRPTGSTDENMDKINKIIKEGRGSTISEIAGKLYGTRQRIL
jgi:hypothetical protein